MIVPGGGLSPDGSEWIANRANFFLSVRVLSRLFRRLFLEGLSKLHSTGQLRFFNEQTGLADPTAFEAMLTPLRRIEWVVYAKEPFAGPKAVLAYLSRYTHRVAISNSRLLRADANGVTFRVKNYHVPSRGLRENHCRARDGPRRYTTMTLAPDEFIRRFLIHVLPKGQHRIRHYGFLGNGRRAANIEKIRDLLQSERPDQDKSQHDATDDAGDQPRTLDLPCPHCGGRLIIIDNFPRGWQPRAPPPTPRAAA